MSGRLQASLGVALVRLGRDKEAMAAFMQALKVAREGAMTGLEANVRGHIADYYLRQHDYVQAAEEARLALKASLLVNNENMTVMAKANLGFALMGQGKFAEGGMWVDGVIGELTKAGPAPTSLPCSTRRAGCKRVPACTRKRWQQCALSRQNS